jgi:hypothetical protein
MMLPADSPRFCAGSTMRKRSMPLGKVYSLLEPGQVVLLSTAHQGFLQLA